MPCPFQLTKLTKGRSMCGTTPDAYIFQTHGERLPYSKQAIEVRILVITASQNN